MTYPIPPGAGLGILGSGQLGRMFAHAAQRMGYRVGVYSPDASSPAARSPAGAVADFETVGSYEDEEALRRFAKTVSVVTLEFENVSPRALEILSRDTLVAPNPQALEITRHRLREKTFVRDAGVAVPAFARIAAEDDVAPARIAVGAEGVLKTATGGYDGKGQRRVRRGDDLLAAWRELGSRETIYEAFVPFQGEYSVFAARGPSGEISTIGPMRNEHAEGILDVTVYPTALDERLQTEAREIARTLVERLDLVGALCVELFLTVDGGWMVNELAPRPHNSAHWTIEAASPSQFELQVRAVCGLPLPEVVISRPAAMANLLGELWHDGEPRWAEALRLPETRLHLYGKSDPRPGRKMGHLTATAPTPDEAERRVRVARAALTSS